MDTSSGNDSRNVDGVDATISEDEAVRLLGEGEEGIKEWNKSKKTWNEGRRAAGRRPYVQFVRGDSWVQKIGKELDGVDFAHLWLVGADLSNTSLIRADLSGARLDDAKLTGAKLQGADLTGAVLRRANLKGAKLCHEIPYAQSLAVRRIAGGFEAGWVFAPSLADADFLEANLDEADLRGAGFDGVFRWWWTFASHLRQVGAIAKMPRWKLALGFARQAFFALKEARRRFFLKSIKLNETRIRNTIFPARMCDHWSVLRRNYTGTRFVFHLLFLLAFFVPFVIRAALFVGVAQAEAQTTGRIVARVATAGRELAESVDPSARLWAESAQAMASRSPEWATREARELATVHSERLVALRLVLQDAIPLASSIDEDATAWALEAQQWLRIVSALDVEVREETVGVLLLTGDSPISYMAAWLLIVYNGLRALLTWRVGQLRDQEERSWISPSVMSYTPLYWLHIPVSLLAIFAIGLALLSWANTLSQRILIPV